jgi:CTP:molybdopterin cytidylyltransferase MocA
MIPGLILAAGRSSRMGRAKALLPYGRSSFLAAVAAALSAGGITDLIVVVRSDDSDTAAAVTRIGAGLRATRMCCVPNADADSGQLSSVLAGLNATDAPGVEGLLIIPVDMPLVSAGTVARLLGTFRETRAPIVRPVHQGKHGHPVIFSRVLFDDLRLADPSTGARAVVHAHAGLIVDVEVNDPGVLSDVDTPEDYARLVGGFPEQ